jgi:signal peptidase II
VSFLGDTIRLDYAENPGGFLTVGASLPPRWRTAAFTIAGGAGIAAILLYALLAPRCGPVRVLALSLFCAGGIGPLRTGIFNVADVALMAACFLLLWPIRPGTKHEG